MADRSDILAIDVHAHYGTYYRSHLTPLMNGFMSGDAATVARRAVKAATAVTVVSPLSGLFPRGEADVAGANVEAARVVGETDGLRQWVIVEPRIPETFHQAADLLATDRCAGIKIHGEEHVYPITEHGEALFAFAARHRAVVLAHSGDAHTMPMDFVAFADRYPEVTLILAHLGHNGVDSDPSQQVRAITASRHGNICTDTSSASSIMPGLIEWAVREAGAERVLYGTDSPLYFAPNQRARIDHADLRDSEKRAILRGNAARLLGLR